MKQLCTKHNLWNDGRCPRCALDSGLAEAGFDDVVGGETITTTEVSVNEHRASRELPVLDLGPTPFDRAMSFLGVPVLSGAQGNSPAVVSVAGVAVLVAANAWLMVQGGTAVRAAGWRVDDPNYIPAAYAWAVEGSILDLFTTAYFGLVFAAALERRIPKLSLILGVLALGSGGMLIERQLGVAGQVLHGGHGVVAGLLGACIAIQSSASANLLFGRVQIPFLLWGVPFFLLRFWAIFNGDGYEIDVVGFFAGIAGGWFVQQRLNG